MSESYFYSSLTGQQIEDTLVGAVRFNAGQTLSNAQKALARQNIGAGSEATGFQILGYYDTLADMQAALQVPPQPGDAYGIGESEPYDIYVFDGATETWVNNGTLNVDVVIDDADTTDHTTWSSSKINSTLSVNGIVKGNGAGALSPATLGSDYTAVDDSSDSSSTKTWSITKILQAISGFVSFKATQALTDSEKALARSNIGADWTLVWENAYPDSSSGFAAQTVPLNLSNYTEVMIQFHRPYNYAYGTGGVASVWGCIGQTLYMQFAFYQICWRLADVASTGVSFGDGYALTSNINQAPTVTNVATVPVRIYAR